MLMHVGPCRVPTFLCLAILMVHLSRQLELFGSIEVEPLIVERLATTTFSVSFFDLDGTEVTPSGDVRFHLVNEDLWENGVVNGLGYTATFRVMASSATIEVYVGGNHAARRDLLVYEPFTAANDLTVTLSNTLSIVSALCMTEERLVVASSSHNDVILYDWSDAGWVYSDNIGVAITSFGTSLACTDDFIFVGSPNCADAGCSSTPGAVFVYENDGSGTFSSSAVLVPTTTQNGAQFGIQLVLSGEEVLVGASKCEDGSSNEAGCAFTIDFSSPTPVISAHELRHTYLITNVYRAGSVLAFDGDLALLGSNSGNVIFSRSAGVWSKESEELIGVSAAFLSGSYLSLAYSSTSEFNVYKRKSSSTWKQKFLGASYVSADVTSIVMHEELVLISASSDNYGKIVLFERNPDSVDETDYYTLMFAHSGTNTHDSLGQCISLRGGRLVASTDNFGSSTKTFLTMDTRIDTPVYAERIFLDDGTTTAFAVRLSNYLGDPITDEASIEVITP
eukprot:gnl/Chilomastix_cuspidata/4075.p1 GENE.gnl/Chilomastix_cuspidata/4075~~gnl/Chilomastix_cuspidata/4075.p1  ORF type:complete len:507 (+),score=61.63 gnl/Chilomastix_cuspidata/4075:229-1749(+)